MRTWMLTIAYTQSQCVQDFLYPHGDGGECIVHY